MIKQPARLAVIAAAALTVGAAAASPAAAQSVRTGNVVFLHPDGTGLNHWDAGRTYWLGPDAFSPWDDLTESALYRGNQADRLVGTSNGGATTHAFGYKVSGPGSFGKDGDGAASRFIDSLSGYPGSIMREAANEARYEVGVVNDGTIAEPGTGAFLAEVPNRSNFNEIALQMVKGRPGANDRPVHVLLGGGEQHFLPEGEEGVHGEGTRTDGRNLIEEAEDDGYLVIRTRAEFERIEERLRRNPDYSPKLLGLFATFHTFNDQPEEALIREGLVDSSIPANDKRSNLLLYGSPRGTAGFNPPTVDEMSAMAAEILDRRAKRRSRSWFLVSEPESTDNFGNNNNAIGSLTAVKRSYDTIAALRRYTDRNDTLLFTAADSDASGLQVTDQSGETTGNQNNNPTGEDAEDRPVPIDGLYGRNTRPFEAEPDQFGQRLRFGILWAGPDVRGGIVSKAAGLNASRLRTVFGQRRFDNIDVYRYAYETLFGRKLDYPAGRRAPTRSGTAASRQR